MCSLYLSDFTGNTMQTRKAKITPKPDKHGTTKNEFLLHEYFAK